MSSGHDATVPPTLDVEPIPPTADVEPIPPTADVELLSSAVGVGPVGGLAEDLGDSKTAGTSGFYFPFELPGELSQRFERVPKTLPGGGQSEVMVVRDRASGERRVVKRYTHNRRRLADAADRLMATDRKHIVRLYPETGEYGGRWFEVMEYIGGGTIAHFDGYGKRPLDAEVVVGVVREVSAALSYVHHDLKMIHRDIKPSNILCRSMDPIDLVLADLGTVAAYDSSRDFGSGDVGTYQYNLLEAMNGLKVPAWDWGSLGIIVFEMVSGEHPFRAPDGDWFSAPHVRDMLIFDTAFDLDAITDRRFRTLCAGLLSRDREGPAARWDGADVHDWLAGLPVRDVEAVRPARRGAQQGVRPFVFLDSSYTAPEPLAAALALNWDEALRVLKGRHAAVPTEHELFVEFFAHAGRPDLVELAQGDATDNSRKLAELLVAMNPAMPATFRGRDITPSGLIAMCVEARSATTQEAAAASALLSEIRQDGLLTAYVGAPGCKDYPAVDASWRRMTEEEATWAASTGQPELQPGTELEQHAGTILNALLDTSFAAGLATQASQARQTPEALRQSWFARLANQNPPQENLRPALDILVLSAAQIATRQHDAQERLARAKAADLARQTKAKAEAEAAERRRRTQERQRQEEEARRVAKAKSRRQRREGRHTLFSNLLLDTVLIIVWPMILFYPVALLAAFGKFLGPFHDNISKLEMPFIFATVIMLLCTWLVNLKSFLSDSSNRALEGVWGWVPGACFLGGIPVFVVVIIITPFLGINLPAKMPLSPLMIWGAALTPPACLLAEEFLGLGADSELAGDIAIYATLAVFALLILIS